MYPNLQTTRAHQKEMFLGSFAGRGGHVMGAGNSPRGMNVVGVAIRARTGWNEAALGLREPRPELQSSGPSINKFCSTHGHGT